MEENLSVVKNLTTTRVREQSGYARSADYELYSPEKSEQRKKILEFILDNHEPNLNPRYIGLPGKYWFLENRLVHENPKAHVTGVERNYEVFNKSKVMMPGNKRLDKAININNTIKLDMYRTENSIYIYGQLSSLTDSQIIEGARESGTFTKGITNQTALWYDFTTSFNKDTYSIIHNIKNVAHKKVKTVVCLTLLYGRDIIFNGSSEEARVGIIQKALPGFQPIEVWKYKGFKDTPMLNVCGVYP